MKNLLFNEKGLQIPTYQDIYDDFVLQLKQKLGEDFYLDSESPDAQYLAILAKAQFDTCDVIQQAINSFYPQTAQGVNLDRVCGYQNIVRAIPTYSMVDLKVTGVPGTVLDGMIVSDTNGELWTVETGTISELGSVTVQAASVNYGVYAGIGEIQDIVEGSKDITSVHNDTPCIQGRKLESDAELRIRRTNTVLRSSTGTVESVYGELINTPGVVNLNVINNPSHQPDEFGIPPHTMLVSVLGGNDYDVALAISNKKSPGCALIGTTEILIQKKQYVEKILFYRPEYTQCKIQIALTPLTNYAVEYAQNIANKIKEYISSLHIGEAVYIGNLYQICYSVSGSGVPFNVASLKMFVKNGDVFQETQNTIPVAPPNLLVLAEDGIEITDDGTVPTPPKPEPSPDPEPNPGPNPDTTTGESNEEGI